MRPDRAKAARWLVHIVHRWRSVVVQGGGEFTGNATFVPAGGTASSRASAASKHGRTDARRLIPAANGSKPQKNAGYWSSFLTDHGYANGGRARQTADAVEPADSPWEWVYCRRHGGRTDACLFKADETDVQNFPLRSNYHKLHRSSWELRAAQSR